VAELGRLFVVVGANVDEFKRKMEETSKTFADTGKKLEELGKSWNTKVTAPVVALGALSAKSAIDFESAFAGVRKTVDATEEEFSALSEGIRAMAKELPASAVEIAGVSEAAGQLGIANEHILSFTRTMIDLGESTNMSADTAATNLARLANITQMPQTEFDKLGSTIVALGNNLATTEAEIVEMGLRLAGAGSQIGMTEAEILGFAGSLSSVGIAAEAGGSAFSKVMIEMQLATETGGENLENFASVAGMTTDQFARAFREDASQALIAFISGLQGAESQGMSAIKVLDDIGITEVRMRDALLRAAGAGDLFAESISLGTQAWRDNVALTEEAEQRYGTTESKLKIMRNQLNDVAITFGEILLPPLLKVTEKVGQFAEWLNKLDPATKNTILVIGGVVAAIGPLLLIVGKVMSAIAALTPVITAIKVALTGLVAGASAPFVLVGAAIVGAIALIYHFRDEIGAVLGAAIDWVGEKLQAFADFFTGVFEAIRDNTIGVFERMWDGIKQIINWVIDGINTMVRALNALSFDVPDWVPGLGGKKFGFNLSEIPHLADGGNITQPGLALVGEKGPELLRLPRGAQVEPLQGARPAFNVTNNFYSPRELDEYEITRRTETTIRKLEFEYARRF
jgi:TP901 family phage tail tape measure protein